MLVMGTSRLNPPFCGRRIVRRVFARDFLKVARDHRFAHSLRFRLREHFALCFAPEQDMPEFVLRRYPSVANSAGTPRADAVRSAPLMPA